MGPVLALRDECHSGPICPKLGDKRTRIGAQIDANDPNRPLFPSRLRAPNPATGRIAKSWRRASRRRQK
jgi:hypothetical protein